MDSFPQPSPEDVALSNSPLLVIRRSLSAWWTDILLFGAVNLVWAFCLFTVVLGPPATVGMVAAAHHAAHGYKPTWQDVIGGARRYFIQSWIWAGLNAAVLAGVGFALLALSASRSELAFVPMAVLLAVGLLWGITQLYALPYLLEQSRASVLLALRNGLLTTLASPVYTLVLLVAVVLIVVVSGVLVALLFLGGPALIAVIGSHAVVERVQTFGVRERDAGRTPD